MHIDIKQREEYFEINFEIFTPTNYGLIKGLSNNNAIFSILSLEMYCHIVHGISVPWEVFLECIFRFHTCYLGDKLRNKSLLGYF